MRELTTFTDQQQAQRLTAYLVTQAIPATIEEEDGQWVIWVTNDDDREQARRILDVFREDPADRRYDTALSEARQLEKQQAASQKKQRRRDVDLTRRWSGHWWYTWPVTGILIGISVAVAVLCTDWSEPKAGWLGLPQLCNNHDSVLLPHLFFSDFEIHGRMIRYSPDLLGPVTRGEVWRPVTPIFIHFGVLHLLFNMMWMRQLASSVEFVCGSRRYLLMVLLMAVLSNAAQFWWSGPSFGGMSGVVFGMIGYVWMKGRTQPQAGLALSPETVTYSMLWMFLCIGGAFGSVANAAHVGGLVVGMLLGARRMLWKRLTGR